MSPNSDSGPTELLRAWSQGDGSALDQLIPLVYEELHRLARRYMRQERPDHTLQATSLVNEAYLRLIDVNRVEWRDRAHFLAVAAQMMRRILVEFGPETVMRDWKTAKAWLLREIERVGCGGPKPKPYA
jgi:hypothetical protein